MAEQIELGLGLIGIGREWGYADSKVPTENEVLDFLKFSFDLGVRFFDTAPSYGFSEERLGKFLHSISPEQRQGIRVSSKFGDHWNQENSTAYVDHSYDALCRSLDNTIAHLDRIDLLQLHKTDPNVLKSKELWRAFTYAKEIGIKTFGASVSDQESGAMVCKNDFFEYVQIPFNKSNIKFDNVIEKANVNHKHVIINRPFNMGALLYEEDKLLNGQKLADAFQFILDRKFSGVILTGTKSQNHLQENWASFNKVYSHSRIVN